MEFGMRFIFNFIFFGLLFFIIWKFFPDAFNTLVGWVTNLYDYLDHLVRSLVEKVNHATGAEKSVEKANAALLLPFIATFLKK